MTQAEAHKAAYLLEGYMLPRPRESVEATFARAKQETVFQLKQSLEHVESMSLERYLETMKEIHNAS